MKKTIIFWLIFFGLFSNTLNAGWLRQPRISRVVNDIMSLPGKTLDETLDFVSEGYHGTELKPNKLMIVNNDVDAGGLFIASSSDTVDLLGADTVAVLNIPIGSKILGTSILVNEEITYTGGGTTTTVSLTGGVTEEIVPVLGNSVNSDFLEVFSPGIITTGSPTDILFEADRGEFSAGNVTSVVYYMIIAPLPYHTATPTPTPTITPTPTDTPEPTVTPLPLSYCFEGAGTSDVNGTYSHTGSHNDINYYTNPVGFVLSWDTFTWTIVEAEIDMDNWERYYYVSDGSDPATADWHLGGLGATPVPTVTEGDCP
jgi:hypothetical protein